MITVAGGIVSPPTMLIIFLRFTYFRSFDFHRYGIVTLLVYGNPDVTFMCVSVEYVCA